MATRKILSADEDEAFLRKTSRPVKRFNEHLYELLDDMKETLLESGGVGLAAPQVGVLRRAVIVMREDESIVELINPEIVFEEGEQEDLEGCLSFPGKYALVKRPMTVTIRAQNRTGEYFEETQSGLTGRCFAHELDHLDGILFPDHATTRLYTEEELQEMEISEEDMDTGGSLEQVPDNSESDENEGRDTAI